VPPSVNMNAHAGASSSYAAGHGMGMGSGSGSALAQSPMMPTSATPHAGTSASSYFPPDRKAPLEEAIRGKLGLHVEEDAGEFSDPESDELDSDDRFVNFALLSHLAVRLRDNVPRGTHVKGNIPYPRAFTGKDIVVSGILAYRTQNAGWADAMRHL
jgi:hypothetical protein